MENYTWRILLVDDDEEEYLITREMLAAARWGKFTLEWAGTYAAGLSALLNDDFDAALVDFHLDTKEGVDLIREAVAAGSPTPMLLVTGLGSYAVDMQAMQAGAADYLNKQEMTPALLERSIRYTILHKKAEHDLVQANAALRESEGLFHIGLENAPVTVFTQDCSLRYTWVYNPLPGFRTEEMLGKRDEELFNAAEAADLIAAKQKVIHCGERIQREITALIHGEKLIYLLTLEPLRGERDQIIGLRGSGVDVTRLRQLEAQQIVQATHMEVQRHLLEHREMERQVIARNLHDGPVQDLISLIFTMQAAIQLTPPGEARETLENVRDRAKDLAAELRTVCNELRPPSLVKFGLEYAIRSHADVFQNDHPGLELHLDLHSSGLLLPDRTRLALFRIYQEGLNNTLRHAGAHLVRIRLELTPQGTVLEMCDDGHGFVLPADWMELARKGHLGLVGMKERAEAIGGVLEVISTPGAGTLLRVTVPTAGGDLS